MFNKVRFILLLQLGLIAGVILFSFNAFASSILVSIPERLGSGVSIAESLPVELTDGKWHVKPSDYRYVDGLTLWLRPTDGESHKVRLYLTLYDYDDNVLYQRERTWVVKRHTKVMFHFPHDVSAADVASLSISVVLDMSWEK